VSTAAQSVLVVDDDEAVAELMSEHLRLRGFEVLQARNGLEALLHVKHARPSAVVLDLAMPRLGGVETLKRICKFDPGIAVVVVTGQADRELHRQALALGARAVLTKPVNHDELFSSLGLSSTPSTTAASEARPPERLSVPTAPAPPSAPQAFVLVVDDDPDMRVVLEEFVKLRQHRVTSVNDAAAALRLILREQPDVVLLDIDMPELSGVDALPTIRALAPAAVVIMVSGTANVDAARRALAHGAFDYVVKPVDLEHLSRSLEFALTMKLVQ